MVRNRLYIDVETTVAPRNEIVELSYIYTSNDNIIETYSAKIKHDEPITAKGYEIHGISDFMCDTEVDEVTPHLTNVLLNAEQVVGHNVEFDIQRIRSWGIASINGILDRLDIKCTMHSYKELWKVAYRGEPRVLTKAFSSMYDCEARLINSGMKESSILAGFKRHFPDEPAIHHSSAYDTYLVYLIDRHMRNASRL